MCIETRHFGQGDWLYFCILNAHVLLVNGFPTTGGSIRVSGAIPEADCADRICRPARTGGYWERRRSELNIRSQYALS